MNIISIKKIKILHSVILFLLLTFSGCHEKQNNLNGKKLIELKCAKCHNLDLPPTTFEDEIAPPMMAVSFHIVGFIHSSSESDKIPKAIEFVKDYVINPSSSKSFCDKKSLASYGVMPSQKGKVTNEELKAIAGYMFEHFTQKNLNEAQLIQNKLAKMPLGERLAMKYKCMGCHTIKKDLVGPAFYKIRDRYKTDNNTIEESINKGSIGKWKGYRVKNMPSFKSRISKKDRETLAKWITSL